jgi:hypothetical protein
VVPDVLDDAPVTASADALVTRVRHAQDIDGKAFECERDWAPASIRVRHLNGFEDTAESVTYAGALRLPDGRLAIGDADSEFPAT